MSSKKEIVNVQVKVPKDKHEAAKLKMIKSSKSSEKSFQKLLMKTIDRFISSKNKKNKNKKDKKKLRK